VGENLQRKVRQKKKYFVTKTKERNGST